MILLYTVKKNNILCILASVNTFAKLICTFTNHQHLILNLDGRKINNREHKITIS